MRVGMLADFDEAARSVPRRKTFVTGSPATEVRKCTLHSARVGGYCPRKC